MIKDILKYAINAPSGNSSQPWKFKLEGEKIYIFNVPDDDITPYNFDQKGSYLAHGALIENLSIIASKYGYQMKTELFPDENQPNNTAIVALEKRILQEDPLFDQILNRATNRRTYKKAQLKLEHKAEILETEAEVAGGGKIKLIESHDKMEKLAKALGLHERLIFENKMIHNIVFSKILWSEKEHSEKRKGLYIKTKFPDLPSFLLPLMRPFGSWSFVQIINKIGLSDKIHKQSAESCISSSALCAILVDSGTNKNFLMAGRLLQRIWLKAAKLNLSIQPVTGIPYLARCILAGETRGFSIEQMELIKGSNEVINNIFEAGNKIIVMICRIGYDDKPPVKTLKLPPDIVVVSD